MSDVVFQETALSVFSVIFDFYCVILGSYGRVEFEKCLCHCVDSKGSKLSSLGTMERRCELA